MSFQNLKFAQLGCAYINHPIMAVSQLSTLYRLELRAQPRQRVEGVEVVDPVAAGDRLDSHEHGRPIKRLFCTVLKYC